MQRFSRSIRTAADGAPSRSCAARCLARRVLSVARTESSEAKAAIGIGDLPKVRRVTRLGAVSLRPVVDSPDRNAGTGKGCPPQTVNGRRDGAPSGLATPASRHQIG